MGKLLDRVLDMDNLRAAWNEVAENRGMPGVDDVSIRRWGRRWEERLVALARDVRANRYRPAKLRVRRIPKKRRDQFRTLRIPTVTDRILQRAVLQVLYEIYEPRFLDCSFGYRPGRSLKDAVQCIVTLRDRGLTWVLDADIDAFFDQVDQELLMAWLGEQVHDPMVLQLISGWLTLTRPDPDEPRGLAMGSPLSPLLANVYLHPLDLGLTVEGRQPVRYADDFVVLTPDRAAAEEAYEVTEQLLTALHLRYEPSKTAVVSFEEGFEFLGVRFEDDAYTYPWDRKRITVEGSRADALFSDYGPHY
jgi:CRISPR-associated protein Cas1